MTKRSRALALWRHPGREEVKLATVVVAIVANTAGAVAALLTLGGSAGTILIVVALAIALTGVWLELEQYRDARPRRFEKSDDSFPFMCNAWKLSEGTVIVTSDMSPAEDPSVYATLKQKAGKRQLTLCVPRKSRDIQVIKELERDGAEVRFYLSDPPGVRFSLLHRGLAYEEVLLGGYDKHSHWEIRRFRGDDLTTVLLRDVTKLLLEVSVPRSRLDGPR